MKNFFFNLLKKILFPLLLVIVSFYYNYQDILFYRPQSIHAWRQADCASITLNYYQHGMDFFKPKVHNLNSDGGKTGYCATSEIPLLYYFTATIYKLSGPHEFIIRLINTLIFFLGLFYLFKMLLYLYHDYFWAVGLSFLFFTSPVLVYYGNNYLTNVSALSLALIGWFYFARYQKETNRKFLLVALFFFFLAGAFKVTALMSLFAVFGYFICEKVGFLVKGPSRIIKNSLLLLFGFVFILVIIGSWVLYAGNYNRCHDCYYFSTTVFPIWTLSLAEIKDLVKHVYSYWMPEYFHPSVFVLLILLFGYITLYFRQANKFYLIVLVLLIFQSIFYILMQFWTFYDHDYYTIEQNIVPIFIIITSFGILYKINRKIIDSVILKILFAVFLLFNVYHAKTKVNDRYNDWRNSYYKDKKEIYSITPYLREIGIKENDKIVYIPDGSNVSLYLMNQPGWTQYTDARFNREASITYNRDSSEIRQSINRGARYLILNSAADIYLHPYVKSFTGHLLGQYGKVLIFDFCDTVRNYTLKEPQIKDTIKCSAETVVNNRFNTSLSDITLGNGNTQSQEYSYNGNYSSKLDSDNLFGMTFISNNLKYGESVVVHVWRKGSRNSGIVASGSAETEFYLSSYEKVLTDSINGWEKLSLRFFVSSKIEDQEIKIYLYNPSQETTYFDDLEIIRYKSIF